jgi:hypothetical protein
MRRGDLRTSCRHARIVERPGCLENNDHNVILLSVWCHVRLCSMEQEASWFQAMAERATADRCDGTRKLGRDRRLYEVVPTRSCGPDKYNGGDPHARRSG